MDTNPPTPSTPSQEMDLDTNLPTSNQEDLGPVELNGWSKDEIYDLNLGLRFHGYDIKEIRKRIPNRTEEQIQAAIDYFKLKLKTRTEKLSPRQKRRHKPLPQIPLTQWAEFLTHIYHYKELQTECATALRIIGNFEDFPHPSSCNGLDFRKMYHYMADAMEGKPLPDDPNARELFHNCLVECSAMGKTFIPKNELEDILAAFSTNCTVNIPRPTKDAGLYALRYLAAQRNYNPLNVPERYLLHRPSDIL